MNALWQVASTCKQAASAMGPKGQWGATATSKASAMENIFLHSVMPPAWERSGWIISTYPSFNRFLNCHLENILSPVAIGVDTCWDISRNASLFSGNTGSSINIGRKD